MIHSNFFSFKVQKFLVDIKYPLKFRYVLVDENRVIESQNLLEVVVSQTPQTTSQQLPLPKVPITTINSIHHHHHQKAFRNKSHTSHGHRLGLKRNKSKGKRLTIN